MNLSCMNFQICKAKQHGAEKERRKFILSLIELRLSAFRPHSYYSAVYGYFKSLQDKQWCRLSP